MAMAEFIAILLIIFWMITCIALILAALIVVLWLARGLKALLRRETPVMPHNLQFCSVCGKADCSEAKHEEDAPVFVTFKFNNPADRDFFMGQLSDGWGEDKCELRWDTTKPFKEATQFHVFALTPRSEY